MDHAENKGKEAKEWSHKTGFQKENTTCPADDKKNQNS
jgi:hypothetical protein